MQKFKQIVSTILIISMILTTNGMFTFAEELSKITLTKEKTSDTPAEYSLESQRISDMPEGDFVYFGAVSTNLKEQDAIFALPIYREGNIDKEASISVISIDIQALYGKDYEILVDDGIEVTKNSDGKTIAEKNGATSVVLPAEVNGDVDDLLTSSSVGEEQVQGFTGTDDIASDSDVENEDDEGENENTNTEEEPIEETSTEKVASENTEEESIEESSTENVVSEKDEDNDEDDDIATISDIDSDEDDDIVELKYDDESETDSENNVVSINTIDENLATESNVDEANSSEEDENTDESTDENTDANVATDSESNENIDENVATDSESNENKDENVATDSDADENNENDAISTKSNITLGINLTEELLGAQKANHVDPMTKIDYSAVANIYFHAGESEKILKFRLYDDKLEEGNESFQLMLVNGHNVNEYTASLFNCQIIDDEEKSDAIINFSSARYYSKDGKVIVKLTRTGRTYGICDFTMTSVGDTAVAVNNYDEINTLVTFAPGEEEKEFTYKVYGSGQFDIKIDGLRGCKKGTTARTTVVINNEAVRTDFSGTGLLGAVWNDSLDDGEHTFQLNAIGDKDKLYVQYDAKGKNGTVGHIFDQSVKPYAHIGDYYFYDNFIHSDSWTTKISISPSTENCLVNGSYLQDGYGDVYYYHSTTTRTGGEARYTDFIIPAVRYYSYLPDWKGRDDFCNGNKVIFKMINSKDNSSIQKERTEDDAKFDRCIDQSHNIKWDTSYDESYLKAYFSAQDDWEGRTPKSGLDFYGVVALFKCFYVETTNPNTLTYALGSAGSTTQYPMYIVPGSGINAGSDEKKYFYPNEKKEDSNLTMRFENTLLQGHSGLFGIVKQYKLGILTPQGGAGAQITKIYPDDYFDFLNSKVTTAETSDFIKFDQQTIDGVIKDASAKNTNDANLRSIPFSEHFIYWITQCAPNPADSDGLIKMYITPVIEHNPIKVIVQKPKDGEGYFTVSTLSSIGEYTFNEGDTLDLHGATTESKKSVTGYEISTDGIYYNSMRSSFTLFLTDDSTKYYVRPLLEDDVNFIEFELSEKAKKVIDLDSLGTIPQDDISEEEYQGRYIYMVDSTKGTTEAKGKVAVGKDYLLKAEIKDGAKPSKNGYYYRPIITDNTASISYNSAMLPYNARGSITDNVIYIDVEEVKKDDIKVFSVSGILQTYNSALRDTGATLIPFACSGYNMSVVPSFSTSSTIDYTINSETDENGNFNLENVYAKSGDILPIHVSNGFYNGQVAMVKVYGSGGEISVGQLQIDYPPCTPKVTSVKYEYSQASLNMNAVLTENTINIQDGDLTLTFSTDAYDRDIEKLIVEVNSIGGAVTEYVATPSAANLEYVAVINQMTDNLYSGDSIYVKAVDKEKNTIQVEGGTKELDICYPTIDTGLVCRKEAVVVQPSYFEVTQADSAEQVEIPLLGSPSAKTQGNSGAISMSKTAIKDNNNADIGYIYTCNLGVGFNKKSYNMQKQRLDGYVAAVDTSQQQNQAKALADYENGDISRKQLEASGVSENSKYDSSVVDKVNSIKSDLDAGNDVSDDDYLYFLENEDKSYKYVNSNGTGINPDSTAKGQSSSSINNELLTGTTGDQDSNGNNQAASDDKAKKAAEGNKENKDPASKLNYTDFTLQIIFVYSGEFLWSEVYQDFVLVNTTYSIGVTGIVDWIKYKTIYGVPCFLNITGTVQVEHSQSIYYEETASAFTAAQFDSYGSNLAVLVGSNTISSQTIVGSLKVSLGTGLKGFLSVGGYVDVTIQFLFKEVEGGESGLDGTLINAGGGVFLELPVTKITIDIARYKYGTGAYSDQSGFSFFGGLANDYDEPVTTTTTLLGANEVENTITKDVFEVLDNGEVHSFETLNAGSSNLSDFGKSRKSNLLGSSLVSGLLGTTTEDGKYGTYTKIKDNVAERLAHKVVKFTNGKVLMVFTGNASDGSSDYNAYRIYYTYSDSYEPGSWSDPAILVQNGTFDALPRITKFTDTDGHEKAIISWSDAMEELTGDMTLDERLSKMKIAAATFDSTDNSVESILDPVDYASSSDAKFMVNPTFVVATDSNIYCFYAEAKANTVSTISDLLDPKKVNQRIYRAKYDKTTNILDVDNKVDIFKIDDNDTTSIITDYRKTSKDVTLYDGSVHTFSFLSTIAYANGDPEDDEDSTIYLTITDLGAPGGPKDFKPIQLTKSGVCASNPYIFMMDNMNYLSYIEDGSSLSLLPFNSLMTTLFNSDKSSYYIASASDGYVDWYKKTADELGYDSDHQDYPPDDDTGTSYTYEYYESSPYKKLYEGDFDVKTTPLNENAETKTTIGSYGICNDNDNVYIVMIKTHEYDSTTAKKGTNKELYCVRYTPATDSDTTLDDDTKKMAGFSKPMQISNFDQAVNEVFVIDKLTDTGYIISYVKKNTEIVNTTTGELEEGEHDYGYYAFKPRSWMEVVKDYVTIMTSCDEDYVPDGKAVSNISYIVKNTGLLPSKGFKTWITLGSDILYEAEFKSTVSDAYFYNTGDEKEINVNVIYDKNVSDKTFNVYVKNLSDGEDTVSVSRTIEDDDTLKFEDLELKYTEANKLNFSGTLINSGNVSHSATTLKARIIDWKGEPTRIVNTISLAALEAGTRNDISFDFETRIGDYTSFGVLKLGIYEGDECIGIASYHVRKPQVLSLNSGDDNLKVTVGGSSTLDVNIAPLGTKSNLQKIVYSSSNNKVATVTSDGTITGISEGTAVITGKYYETNASDTITVTVSEGSTPTPTPTPTPSGGGGGGSGGGRIQAIDFAGLGSRLAGIDPKHIVLLESNAAIEYNPLTNQFLFPIVDTLGNKTYAMNKFVCIRADNGNMDIFMSGPDGAMVTGYVLYNTEGFYYFSPSAMNLGQMQTGFIDIDGQLLYFNPEGKYADSPEKFASTYKHVIDE